MKKLAVAAAVTALFGAVLRPGSGQAAQSADALHHAEAGRIAPLDEARGRSLDQAGDGASVDGR